MDFLTNQVMALLTTVSILSIITAVIMLALGNTFIKELATLILTIFAVIIVSIIGFFSAKAFGLGFPITIAIILLAILLIILLSGIGYSRVFYHPSPKIICENYVPYEGPCITGDNKFGNKIGDQCVKGNNQTYTLPDDNKIKLLQDKLKLSEEQCEKKTEEIHDIIDKETNKYTKLAQGPCVAADGSWGYRTPKYGRKCLSMKELTQYEKGKDVSAKIKPDTKAKCVIKEPCPATSTCTACLNPEADFESLCRDKHPEYGVKKVYDCCINDSKNKQAECARGYTNGFSFKSLPPKDIDTTMKECRPTTDNFDFWCRSQFGSNFGYKKILSGKAAGCRTDGMSRAICSELYRNGAPIMVERSLHLLNKTNPKYFPVTKCAKWEADFNQLCREIYGPKSFAKDKLGMDCYPGFGRGVCQ